MIGYTLGITVLHGFRFAQRPFGTGIGYMVVGSTFKIPTRPGVGDMYIGTTFIVK